MSTTREKLQLSCGHKQNFWLSLVNSLSRVLLVFTLFEYCIRAFAVGMVYAISCQDLPFQYKKMSTTVRSWHGKAKKICNTATVPLHTATIPLQICDGIVAALQIQKLLFYSTYNFCMVSTVSFSLFLQNILLYYVDILFYCIDVLF